MYRLLLFLAFPFLASCMVSASLNYTHNINTSGTFDRNQVKPAGVLERFVMQPNVLAEQKRTLKPFKLAQREFLTMEADLNNDGQKDIIGTVDNSKFKTEKGYPLYILIKDEYSYHQIDTDARTLKFNVKVLDIDSNGFKDLLVDGTIIKYDKSVYK